MFPHGALFTRCVCCVYPVVAASQEVSIVVQGVRLNTLSKLTFADSKRFDALLKDVFCGVKFEEIENPDLKKALVETCTEQHLTIEPTQVRGDPRELADTPAHTHCVNLCMRHSINRHVCHCATYIICMYILMYMCNCTIYIMC